MKTTTQALFSACASLPPPCKSRTASSFLHDSTTLTHGRTRYGATAACRTMPAETNRSGSKGGGSQGGGKADDSLNVGRSVRATTGMPREHSELPGVERSCAGPESGHGARRLVRGVG